MSRIIPLLTILTCVGCQTAKESTEYDYEPKPKTIILTVNKNGSAYDAQLKITTVDDKTIFRQVSKQPNEWGTIDHVIDIQGFTYTTRALLGDELVEINCEPGTRAKIKTIPQEDGYVRVKGLYVYNRLKNKNITNPTTVIPFNVIVKIDEPTVIYEMKMKLEPAG